MTGLAPTTPRPPNRWTYTVLALAAAGFIVYGSLVPLDFRPRPLEEVLRAYSWAMSNRVMIQSRADGLTNILVAVPLGFSLLAMSRVDRGDDRGRDVAAAIRWLPACIALAAAVEFAQLYLPSRTCGASDVLCQGVGAGAGMALWISFGRRLNSWARRLWGRVPDSGTAGRVLGFYLLLVAFIQALPFDLNPSPKGLYRKVRDEARFVPFQEFPEDGGDPWEATAKCIRIVGLFLPAGLLASRLRGRVASVPGMLAFAFAVSLSAETIQIAIRSRHPAATDAIAALTGTVAGWLLGRRFAGGMRLEAGLLLGQAWAAALLVAFWQPFNDRIPRAEFDWLPGMPVDSGVPLLTLLDYLFKLVLFAPFGALVVKVTWRSRDWIALVYAAAIGAAVSGAIEVGQMFVGAYTPGITDVMLGAGGAFAGAWVALRTA